jgi:hypothetical protein
MAVTVQTKPRATPPQDLTVPDVLPDVQPDLNAPGIITAEVQTEPAVSIENVEHLLNPSVSHSTPEIPTQIDQLQHLVKQVAQLTLVINTILQLLAPPKHT